MDHPDLRLRGIEGGEVTIGRPVLSAFERRLTGEAIWPGDEGYDEARRLWNGMHDRRPGLIVRCREAADVEACVDLCRDFGALLSVRGGGHNVAGNALCDGGLAVDLSGMRSVQVDPAAGLVRIEGGATLGDVDRATARLGLATPMGVVTATGYAGLALHGGAGWMLRKHGLASDNVVGVDIVTADGRLRRVDRDADPDLLWAVRGGGGSFGVVTSFTARLHPVPREVIFAAPIYALDDAPAVLRFVRDYMASAPDELMVLPVFWTAPDQPEVPASRRGSHVLFVLACHVGPADKGERIVAPLRDVRPLVADLTARKRWVVAQEFFDEDYPDGRRYYWKSTLVRELTDRLVDAMIEHTMARPSMLTSIDLWCLGGAFGRVGAGETAFGDRGVAFMVNYEANWIDPRSDRANIEWARGSLAEAQRLTQARTYLNFAGLGEEGEQLVRASVGGNYPRLQAVKAAHDPHNLFRTNFNVTPGSSAR